MSLIMKPLNEQNITIIIQILYIIYDHITIHQNNITLMIRTHTKDFLLYCDNYANITTLHTHPQWYMIGQRHHWNTAYTMYLFILKIPL